MSPTQQLVALGLSALAIRLIYTYYWLRVMACGIILAIWGGVAICGPLYFALDDFKEGNFIQGLMTILPSLVLAAFWYMGFDAARTWVKDESKRGRWTQMPWNSP